MLEITIRPKELSVLSTVSQLTKRRLTILIFVIWGVVWCFLGGFVRVLSYLSHFSMERYYFYPDLIEAIQSVSI